MFTSILNVLGFTVLMTLSDIYEFLFVKGLFVLYIIGAFFAPQVVGFIGTFGVLALFIGNLCIATFSPESNAISASLSN